MDLFRVAESQPRKSMESPIFNDTCERDIFAGMFDFDCGLLTGPRVWDNHDVPTVDFGKSIPLVTSRFDRHWADFAFFDWGPVSAILIR